MSTAGLPPEEVQYQEAHAYEDYTRNLGGFYIVVVFLTFISVVLRVFSRRITKQELKADDWIYITGAVWPLHQYSEKSTNSHSKILAEGSYFVLLIYGILLLLLLLFISRLKLLAFDAGLGAHWALLTTDQQALFRKVREGSTSLLRCLGTDFHVKAKLRLQHPQCRQLSSHQDIDPPSLPSHLR